MATHPFLSPTWIDESRKLRVKFADRIQPPATAAVRFNLIVAGVPFGDDVLHAHLDTSGGEPEIELGHLDAVDATITVDYTTAKSIFVDTNIAAAMEAMQLGRIQVQGDVMKLMALAGLNADAASIELGRRIRAITE